MKFELWSIGGFRVYLRGCDDIAAKLAEAYSPEGARSFDYGFVGDIESVNHTLLGELLGAGVTPVFCAIMHDGRARCSTATPTAWLRPWHSVPPGSPPRSWFLFEKAACCATRTDETTLIREITAESYAALKAGGIVSKG